MHPQNNKPLDKGRVACIAEKYQQGNETKNRYATLGRATKWPSSKTRRNKTSHNIASAGSKQHPQKSPFNTGFLMREIK